MKKLLVFINILSLFLILSPVFSEEKPATEKNPIKLDNVVVSDKKESTVEQATTSTEITSEDIRTHSDKTLDDSLKMVPGLQIEMHHKGHMRARFRGFNQDKIAILVDGIPLSDVFATDIDISSILVMNISDITVSRGTTSALYGARGAVGAIDIKTVKPESFFTDINTEYGLPKTSSVNAAFGDHPGNIYYWFSGSVLYSGGFTPSEKLDSKTRREWFDKVVPYGLYGHTYEDVLIPGKDDYIFDSGEWDHQEYTKYFISGKLGYDFDKIGDAGLSTGYSFYTGKTNSFQPACYSDYKGDGDFWVNPRFELSSDPEDIKKAVFRNRSFVWPAVHNLNVSPYCDLKFNKFKIKGNVFFSWRKAEQEGYASTDHTYVKDSVLADTAYEPFREFKTYRSYGFNLYPSFYPVSWNRLTLSFLFKADIFQEDNQAKSENLSPAISSTVFGMNPYPVKHLEAFQFSIGIEDEIDITKRLLLTLGVSYDGQYFYEFLNREALYQYEEAYIVELDSSVLGTKDSVNPVVGLVYTAIDDLLCLRMSGSMKTRFPNLGEYSKIVDDRHDHGLKPERSYNGNTGFDLFLMDGQLNIRTDIFTSIVKDRIEKVQGGMLPPENLERVESYGCEFITGFEKDRIGGIADFKINFSYTYLYTRNRDDSNEEKVNMGKMIEMTPEHQFTLDCRVNFTTGTGICLWGYSTLNQVIYVMKSAPDTTSIGVDYSTEYFKTIKLHDPVMLNLRITQKFLKIFEAGIMCRNILDDYNADPFNPGPGRTFWVSLSAKLR